LTVDTVSPEIEKEEIAGFTFCLNPAAAMVDAAGTA
jgi:hypothetical protein